MFNISNQMVTLLSLLFTSISIGLSVGEYCLSKQLLKSDSYVVASFKVNSSEIEVMSRKQFRSKIMFRQKVFISEIAKILEIESCRIDLLIPVQTKTGALFVLHIDFYAPTVHSTLSRHIANQDIAKVCFRVIYY